MRTIAIVAGLLLAGTAVAADPAVNQGISSLKGSGRYGSAGCGLGSLIFQDQPGAVQIFAATTNGTSANQTFAITTGTSNCGPSLFASGVKNFVDANRDALAKDMSRGQGETVLALSALAGCSDARKVGAALQSRYATIIPDDKATSAQIADALVRTLASDRALGCQIG